MNNLEQLKTLFTLAKDKDNTFIYSRLPKGIIFNLIDTEPDECLLSFKNKLYIVYIENNQVKVIEYLSTFEKIKRFFSNFLNFKL